MSRRSFLTGGAAAAAGVAATQLVGTRAEARAAVPKAGKQARRTGTVKDVEHVVVLMQENRSFDHYYGSLGGVTGLGDRRALPYPDGSTVLHQPDAQRTDGRTLLPWHMDTARFDAQQAGDLDHSWTGTHQAWNGGAWNGWVGAKGEETMGYYTRSDIPWQYALADAYTICDHYFCSIQGPTRPNRLFLMSGTNDPNGLAGGPAISNPADYDPVWRWTTYPERLQAAGVTWQVYANDEVGDGADGWVGDYGDNVLWTFHAYHDALASSDPAVRELAERGGLHDGWKPSSGQGQDVDHVLDRFIADCADNTLPTVCWIVSPYLWSEHPQGRPVDGATYTQRVLQALWDNPSLWESTVVLLNFDENDGFYDHVVPPAPPAGTQDEFVDGLPVGLGPRVPMTVISPWSHGGWVNSEVFDHTSVVRFLELVTGVQEPNISAWRRQVCGDLTSCLDFADWDPTVPTLPDLAALTRIADAEKTLPVPTPPATGAQAPPKPEYASRPQRPTPYQPKVDLAVNRSSGRVVVTAANTGAAAVALSVYDNRADTFTAVPLLVRAGGTGVWGKDTAGDVNHYDLTVIGPNSFLRQFAGTVAAASDKHSAAPTITAVGSGSTLRLTVTNTGKAANLTFAALDFTTRTSAVAVPKNKSITVDWPLTGGWYDLVITSDADTSFRFRYAGKIESS